MNLISEQLKESLYNQILHERTNSTIYLYISAFLKNKGFNNLAAHFEKQYKEETEHAEMIVNFLTDLNVDVMIPTTPEVNLSFDSIVSIAKLYFDREFQTTESLKEIKNFSVDDDNCVVEEFVRKMIFNQIAEYSEATDFMDKANLCGDDWFKVMLWDLNVG